MRLNANIIALDTAGWAARTATIPKRALGFNTDTGELRKGGAVWAKCRPLNQQPNTEVVAATTANITLNTALNDGDTLDGVTLHDGDLVLVKNQSTATQNGVYVVGSSPARAAAYDQFNEHVSKVIRVAGGTQNKDKFFFCNVVTGGTLGSTAITFQPLLKEGLRKDEIYPFSNLPELTSGELHAEDQLLVQDHLTGQLKHVTLASLKLFANS